MAKFGKLWNQALNTGRPDKPRLLVWDADLVVYQCLWDHMTETPMGDGMWTWVLDLKEAQQSLEARILEAHDLLWADRSVMAVGGLNNWRKMVLPTYKANRDQVKKPLGWWKVIKWLGTICQVVRVPSLEADDICGIIHTAGDRVVDFGGGIRVDRRGMETVTISEDKDFECLPGLWFNPRKPADGVRMVTPQQAIFAHGLQTLTGDATDNYTGCPGVGPVAARKVLPLPDRGLTDLQYQGEIWRAVLDLYTKKGLDAQEAATQATVAYLLHYGDWDHKRGEVVLWQAP